MPPRPKTSSGSSVDKSPYALLDVKKVRTPSSTSTVITEGSASARGRSEPGGNVEWKKKVCCEICLALLSVGVMVRVKG